MKLRNCSHCGQQVLVGKYCDVCGAEAPRFVAHWKRSSIIGFSLTLFYFRGSYFSNALRWAWSWIGQASQGNFTGNCVPSVGIVCGSGQESVEATLTRWVLFGYVSENNVLFNYLPFLDFLLVLVVVSVSCLVDYRWIFAKVRGIFAR